MHAKDATDVGSGEEVEEEDGEAVKSKTGLSHSNEALFVASFRFLKALAKENIQVQRRCVPNANLQPSQYSNIHVTVHLCYPLMSTCHVLHSLVHVQVVRPHGRPARDQSCSLTHCRGTDRGVHGWPRALPEGARGTGGEAVPDGVLCGGEGGES